MKEAAIREFLQAEQLPDSYRTLIVQHLLPLAKMVRNAHRQRGNSLLVGINGAQGTGKSTLAKLLHQILQHEHGLKVVSFSLDDFYLPQPARQQLAATAHPLLATRGVPGTHDIALLQQCLEALRNPGCDKLHLPRFSKASDNRLPENDWQQAETPVDIILFEGWCVGVAPQAEHALQQPANSLEATEDSTGDWRRYVNQQLAQHYAPIFADIDYLIMLRAPSFYAVYQWRCLQESKLRATLAQRGDSDAKLMGEAELARFIQYFERLTRHALATLPDKAHCVLSLDPDHQVSEVRYRE